MKTLLMMPVYITIFIIAISCLAGNARAAFIEFDNPAMTREDRMVKRQVDKYKVAGGYKITVQGHCVRGCFKPLDGREDAIEISQARTGLPDEYINIPVKPTQHYTGR